MNMGTFEAMDQMEMMEVNGGARSRSDRRAAQRAARANVTVRNVTQTTAYVAPIVLTMAAGTPAGIAVGAAVLAAGWYWA